MHLQGAKEKLLGAVLLELFPYHKIYVNERREGNIVSNNTDQLLELDFYIKDLKLAFEYQDPHHFNTTWYYQKSKKTIRDTDNMKQKIASDHGISLIRVPCWWDGSRDRLVATIKKVRPEILKNYVVPAGCGAISDEPPANYFFVYEIPGIGELMAPTFPSSTSFQPDSWWISEKYDGIRGCWVPTENVLFSRYGKRLYTPHSYKKIFPKVFLDGEIWFGRGKYHEASNFARSGEDETNLFSPFFRYVAFDALSMEIHDIPFEDRLLAYLFPIVDDSHPCIIIPAFMRCKNKKSLKKIVEWVLEDSGEGLVLRQPRSAYENGKSQSVVKMKAGRDQEALVVGAELGSYTLQLPSGLVFVISTKDLHFPKIGDVVSFSYERVSRSGEPVNPLITRVRDDVAWDMILYKHHSNSPQAQSLNAVTANLFAHGTSKPHGYWTTENGKNIRAFFDTFAAVRKLDPRSPRSWYNITASEVITSEGGRSVLSHYEDSVVDAIKDVYPDIGLVNSFFRQLPPEHFHDFQNRKQLFDDFSALHSFSPFVAPNWISPRVQIAMYDEPNILHVISKFYSGKISNAIRSVYPAASDLQSLEVSRSGKEIFDEIAKQRGFDPLQARNWYSLSKKDILSVLGGFDFLVGNAGNFAKELMRVYPEVAWDESQFDALPKKYWWKNRRTFFEAFAAKKGFDALVPEGWYPVTKEMICNENGGSLVLAERSIPSVLAEQFPEIKFDRSKFASLSRRKRSEI